MRSIAVCVLCLFLSVFSGLPLNDWTWTSEGRWCWRGWEVQVVCVYAVSRICVWTGRFIYEYVWVCVCVFLFVLFWVVFSGLPMSACTYASECRWCGRGWEVQVVCVLSGFAHLRLDWSVHLWWVCVCIFVGAVCSRYYVNVRKPLSLVYTCE